ncbi:MAG: DUF1571 domain-containing protein [Planctomycetia bacterium]|nr:DUF1571 domain-containing protein [Planctomycetia bacterium]
MKNQLLIARTFVFCSFLVSTSGVLISEDLGTPNAPSVEFNSSHLDSAFSSTSSPSATPSTSSSASSSASMLEMLPMEVHNIPGSYRPADSEDEELIAHLVPLEGEAPLMAPIRWAKAGARHIQAEIRDYSCRIVKRERINGVLGREETIFAKVRHEPFSVYMKFEAPRRFRGREVIYVEGKNDGLLAVHGVGLEALAGTLNISPTGRQAMKNNLHPITEFGILNLARRLAQTGEENLHRASYSVTYAECKLNGQECVCVEVLNSDPHEDALFHKAHVFVDVKRNFPVKYVAWGWPNSAGELPVLEEYTYVDIQTNQNFSDFDFCTTNPEYNYRESRR